MYTQCPECGTVFRVTAPVLRAAQGQVRCGVCDANFDALRFLSDDVELEVNAASASRIVGAGDSRPASGAAPPPAGLTPREFGAATRNRPSADEERALGEIAAQLARGAPARPGPAAPAASAEAAAAAAAAESGETNVLEPVDVEDIELVEDIPDTALEFDVPVDHWDQVFVREEGPTAATALDVDLDRPAPGETLEAPDELMLLEEPDDPLARTDEYRVPDFAARLEQESAPSADIEFEPAAVGELAAGEGGSATPAGASDAPGEPRQPEGRRRSRARFEVPVSSVAAPEAVVVEAAPQQGGAARRAAGIAAAVLLALGLAVQLVHQFRESLAESPIAGPALAALYTRLGLPLEPRWDLTAYDVRQWGAQSEEIAGVLRLRASIVNKAARAQPYPLLRVTLEDRFGAHVGRREFTPAEYLPGRTAPRELLGAGARADADLKLADPGNQAVGFELDVCLPRHGALLCGADAKAGGG